MHRCRSSSRGLRRARRSVATSTLLLALTLGGCAEQSADPTTEATSPTTQTTNPAAQTTYPTTTENDPEATEIRRLAAGGETVTFETTDDVRLRGIVFGTGPSALVLSHMGRTGDNLEDWLVAATELAGPDRTVLVYNRRGVCSRVLDLCSEEYDELDESWRDVVAATRFVNDRGSETVVLGGASIGAMATFHAAAHADVDPDALVWLGGVLHGEYTFDRATARRLPRVPILYVSTVDDVYGGGQAARRMYEWTRDPRRLALLPGTEHGTDLVAVAADRARSTRVITEIDRLVRRVEQQ